MDDPIVEKGISVIIIQDKSGIIVGWGGNNAVFKKNQNIYIYLVDFVGFIVSCERL